MPETEGARLLALLLARYRRPSDADRAMGWPSNTTSVHKARGGIPPEHWDAVRALVEPRAEDIVARLNKRHPDLGEHLVREAALLEQVAELRDLLERLATEVADADLRALAQARYGQRAAAVLRAIDAAERQQDRTRKAAR